MSGNKYEVALEEVWEIFSPYMSGAHAGLICVVGTEPPSQPARDALESSAKALGYGDGAITFVVAEELEQHALFTLIEGLDPLCIVAADGRCAALLGQAYRTSVPAGKATRLLGRTAVAFLDFESLLETPKDKQIAWALLKKLPRFDRK